jgi:AMMECR1 domain-containing protein
MRHPGAVRFVVWYGTPDAVGADEPQPAYFRAVLHMRSLRVWERTPAQVENRPLRFGLSKEDARALLETARQSVSAGVTMGSSATCEPTPWLRAWQRGWSQRCGVAVALWTNGRLRGSIVSHPGAVNRTLARTASLACRDPRFDPLTVEELARTRVQVSLFHAPWIPLRRDEVATDRAYTDKATLLRRESAASIFLPEIFQIRRLDTVRSVGDALAKKAGLGALDRKCELLVCEVDEFVESADHTGVCRLDGPVPRYVEPCDLAAVTVQVGRSACHWLEGLQAEDGGLPQRVCVRIGRPVGYDGIRVAMTGEALAAYGRATDWEPALRVARGVHAWIGHANPAGFDSALERLLFASYAGKLALRLGHVDQARSLGLAVMRSVGDVEFEPLVHAHAASFLRKIAGRIEGASARAATLAMRCMNAFDAAQASRGDMDLARWAELVAALPRGGAEARRVSEWLCSLQLESGAFPVSTGSTFAYARGTSKVFEVLAIDAARFRPALVKAVGWLRTMQYGDDAMFFVAPEHRGAARGGFRHDGANSDAWIDAAGHVLLGLSRLGRA